MDQLMKEAKELMASKDEIEQQLNELEQVLNGAGIGMDEPLVDASGFPRAEIDVHQIRNTRSLIHRLRNDHRNVMSNIESILHRIHDAKRNEPTITTNTTTTVDNHDPTPSNQSLVAFAIVNAVAPDSPAYTAGLRRNDRILKFGHVDATNHERLQALNTLVSQSENRAVSVAVMREDGNRFDFVVTPKSGWGGRGTLGCHILPL
ncbi:MAG: hypothetical protein EXX96DRAFT_320661 [Benjaminiella poitrasii]|nr:MAG: hypothetical protein EXX96DRAFT_320661 [Benjaminiella poitrasii]